jgi:hypothetical protein
MESIIKKYDAKVPKTPSQNTASTYLIIKCNEMMNEKESLLGFLK